MLCLTGVKEIRAQIADLNPGIQWQNVILAAHQGVKNVQVKADVNYAARAKLKKYSAQQKNIASRRVRPNNIFCRKNYELFY